MNIYKIKKLGNIERNYIKQLINIGKRIYNIRPSEEIKKGIMNAYNKLNE